MIIDALSGDFAKAGTDSTDTSFPSRIATGTTPSGLVVDLGYGGSVAPESLVLIPYGTAGDNDTFSMRLIGWRKIGNDPNTLLWIPVILAEFACTLSTQLGVAGRVVVATERFADIITLVDGNEDNSCAIVTPGANLIGHIVANMKGFEKAELTFDSTAAGTTAMNCLFAKTSAVRTSPSTVTIGAGAALLGTVGIDQTTPGTTNLVSATKLGTLTDRSGSIATGGTAQTAANALATRRYLSLQNTSDTDLWFNFTTAAVVNQPSFKLTPGSSFVMDGTFVSTEALSVIGATTGKVYTCKEG